MNILHLRSTVGYYGAERVITTLLAGLSGTAADCQLGILSPDDSAAEPLLSASRQAGIEPISMPSPRMLSLDVLRMLAAHCRSRRVDFVHSHDYKSAVYAQLLASMMKLGRFATVHGWIGGSGTLSLYEKVERLLISRFDQVIVVSEPQRAALLARGMSSDRVTLIPNGLDLSLFHGAPTRDAAGDTSEWLSVGRLSQEKGFDLLLYAFASAFPDAAGPKLTIAGDGPQRAELEKLASMLNVASRVRWLGFVSDVRPLLSAADAYVCSSLTEGMPMSVLEAMAYGLPIVATAVGELPRMLSNDAGIIVPPGDAASLAAAMVRVHHESERRHQLGAAARVRVMEQYSASSQAAKYLNVYQAVAKQPAI